MSGRGSGGAANGTPRKGRGGSLVRAAAGAEGGPAPPLAAAGRGAGPGAARRRRRGRRHRTPSPPPPEVVVRGVPLTSRPDPRFPFAFPFVGVGDREPLPESRLVSRETSSPRIGAQVVSPAGHRPRSSEGSALLAGSASPGKPAAARVLPPAGRPSRCPAPSAERRELCAAAHLVFAAQGGVAVGALEEREKASEERERVKACSQEKPGTSTAAPRAKDAPRAVSTSALVFCASALVPDKVVNHWEPSDLKSLLFETVSTDPGSGGRLRLPTRVGTPAFLHTGLHRGATRHFPMLTSVPERAVQALHTCTIYPEVRIRKKMTSTSVF